MFQKRSINMIHNIYLPQFNVPKTAISEIRYNFSRSLCHSPARKKKRGFPRAFGDVTVER